MSNTDLIKELRALTSAGMSDCKKALEESGWDLAAAVDLIKVRGLNIASDRAGRVASEGVVLAVNSNVIASMIEINCQTDFVANSSDFQNFSRKTLDVLCDRTNHNLEFSVDLVEDARKAVVASTKENIVVRRWWVEEALDPAVRIFSYIHSNNKIGVLLTLQGPPFTLTMDNVSPPWNHPDFVQLGEDLAMQIAAMNPLAVSVDRLPPEEVERQKAIFQTQLQELNKPPASWPKIMEGKMAKWQKEVCLLEQESVIVPKTTVAQVIKSVALKLGGEIQVVNFVRCQVGEGIEKKQDNLTDEVNKLIMDQAYGSDKVK
jgi:elongation factor Ts